MQTDLVLVFYTFDIEINKMNGKKEENKYNGSFYGVSKP